MLVVRGPLLSVSTRWVVLRRNLSGGAQASWAQKGTQHYGQQADAALRGCAGALRSVRRLLPPVSGPDSDLQLRILRTRRHDAGRGADRQDRPGAWQAATAAGHDAARCWLWLG